MSDIDDNETAEFVENMMREIMAGTTDRGASNRTIRRIKDRLLDEFPVGSSVTMSAEGEKNFPKYIGKSGEVTGYEKDVSVKVRFAGNKTASGWHPNWLKLIPHS